MKKTAIFLMIISILSKLFGFARELTLSYFYGASNITDAYLISSTIPSVIFGFIGIGISTGFIPMYSKINQTEGSKEAAKYTNNLINILIVLCTIIFVFGVIFTMPIVKLFASGFEGETLELAVKFTRISLLGIYFTGLIYIFNGFLQIKDNYVIPALIGFPTNLLTILFIVLSTKGDVKLLAVGIVVVAASQLLFVLPFAYKKGYRYKPLLNIKDKYIKRMFRIALPVIIGSSFDRINVLVDRTIASRVAEGGITALNYADKINNLAQGIFVLSITTALYPMISKMVAEGNINSLKKSVSEAINSVNLLIIPITVGVMIFARPIVTLLFGRGQFDIDALNMTTGALFFYAIGMIGFGLSQILSRTFYSMQDTKTPAIIATISLTLNLILNITLSRFMGIGGLALGTSISAVFGTVLLFIRLRKKIGSFGLKEITISFIKIVGVSLVMGVLAKFVFNVANLRLSQNLALIFAVGVGAMVYGVLICFMKIEEVDVLIELVRRKIRR